MKPLFSIHATSSINKGLFIESVEAKQDIIPDMVQEKKLKSDIVWIIKLGLFKSELARLGRIRPCTGAVSQRDQASLSVKHEFNRLAKIVPGLLCCVHGEDEKEAKRLSKITPGLLDSNYWLHRPVCTQCHWRGKCNCHSEPLPEELCYPMCNSMTIPVYNLDTTCMCASTESEPLFDPDAVVEECSDWSSFERDCKLIKVALKETVS